ncbi:hypothetical protein ALC56_03871 [Trachymyrmex septentrionalis]|uniref:Uncharacterized protein n=1 Tax=Trachymyrmex septentrionalis TaxID=34720 RepID=A0A195FMN6_9HYME|nr:hypothetical protein ALC56_03871 [Trachymyrmex septentrionalis]
MGEELPRNVVTSAREIKASKGFTNPSLSFFQPKLPVTGHGVLYSWKLLEKTSCTKGDNRATNVKHFNAILGLSESSGLVLVSVHSVDGLTDEISRGSSGGRAARGTLVQFTSILCKLVVNEARFPLQPLLHHFERHDRNIRRDELLCGGERRGEIRKIPTLISLARRAAAVDGAGRAWYVAGHELVPTCSGDYNIGTHSGRVRVDFQRDAQCSRISVHTYYRICFVSWIIPDSGDNLSFRGYPFANFRQRQSAIKKGKKERIKEGCTYLPLTVLLYRFDLDGRHNDCVRFVNQLFVAFSDLNLLQQIDAFIDCDVGNSPAMPKPTEWRRSYRRSSFPKTTNAKLLFSKNDRIRMRKRKLWESLCSVKLFTFEGGVNSTGGCCFSCLQESTLWPLSPI